LTKPLQQPHYQPINHNYNINPYNQSLLQKTTIIMARFCIPVSWRNFTFSNFKIEVLLDISPFFRFWFWRSRIKFNQLVRLKMIWRVVSSNFSGIFSYIFVTPGTCLLKINNILALEKSYNNSTKFNHDTILNFVFNRPDSCFPVSF
jgi:hypothetical protein